MGYEYFEHTADLGIRVWASSLEELFCEAAEALFKAMFANLEEVRLERVVHFRLSAGKLEDLFYDWLAELLYVFDRNRIVLREFDVAIEGTRLSATARGENFDPTRHEGHMEVKAVTYHGLRVEKTLLGDWRGEVIVDL